MHAYFTLTTENLVSKLRSAVTIKYASDFENLVWSYECKILQFIYVILCWNNTLDILVQIRCIIKINFNCFLLLFEMCSIEIIKLHKWLCYISTSVALDSNTTILHCLSQSTPMYGLKLSLLPNLKQDLVITTQHSPWIFWKNSLPLYTHTSLHKTPIIYPLLNVKVNFFTYWLKSNHFLPCFIWKSKVSAMLLYLATDLFLNITF